MKRTMKQIVHRIWLFIRAHPLLILWCALFLSLSLLYADIGILKDGDSESYMYLIRGGEYPDYIRPVVYPSVLYLAHWIGRSYADVALFIIQAGVFSGALVLLFSLLQNTAKNISLSLGVLFLCWSNLNVTQYVNNRNPEILLTSLLVLLVYLFQKMLYNRWGAIWVVLCITCIAFTKPIFLYFPLVFFAYQMVLYFCKYIPLRSLAILGMLLSIFYLLPVSLWSYGNYRNHGYYTFSKIKQINILGKIVEYHMVESGPDYVYGVNVKRLINTYARTDPWVLDDYINNSKMASDERRKIELAILSFTETVFHANKFTFILKSLWLIPKFLHWNAYINVNVCDGVDYISIPCLIRWFMKLDGNYYVPYVSKLLPIIFYLSYLHFVYHVYRLLNRIATPFDQLFILAFIVVFYYIFASTMGLYNNAISRILSPIYPVMILLFALCIRDYMNIGQYLKSPKAKWKSMWHV